MPETALKKDIDKLAKDARQDDSIIADSHERRDWLCRQLIAYPVRVDPRFTTNLQFLMVSASRTIADQAAQIKDLEAKLAAKKKAA